MADKTCPQRTKNVVESINQSINIYSQQFPELYIITCTYTY